MLVAAARVIDWLRGRFDILFNPLDEVTARVVFVVVMVDILAACTAAHVLGKLPFKLCALL
jgi:hypothetical protein